MKPEELMKEPFQINTIGSGNMPDIFSGVPVTYINVFNLFITRFNCIPNFTHEINIDCKKANHFFFEKYKDNITDIHFSKRYLNSLKSKAAELDDVLYTLYEDLIVNFDHGQSTVRFAFRKTSYTVIETITEEIKKFQERKTKRQSKLCLLTAGSNGISCNWVQVNKPKLSIDQNYNDDFAAIHSIILKRLSKKDDKGIVLLHGKPGTGKTSYIRHLISVLKKNVIFLTPGMAAKITNPDLMGVLMDNSNSILVIEDAENILIDRERNGASMVSALLNVSDGLLSDCLNIQIICSFNTDISKVDNALMRKGRLIAKYEFKELETAKAQALSYKLGFDTIINEAMTVAQIYNQGEREFEEKRNLSVIGFKR